MALPSLARPASESGPLAADYPACGVPQSLMAAAKPRELVPGRVWEVPCCLPMEAFWCVHGPPQVTEYNFRVKNCGRGHARTSKKAALAALQQHHALSRARARMRQVRRGKSGVEVRTAFQRHCARNGIAIRGLTLWCDTDSALAMAKDFVQWLDSEGGNLRCSAPGDNFQNGQAETRINDYKMKVKALMKERGAPDRARSWARDHATLLLNNTPTRRHLTSLAFPYDMRTPNEVHGRETTDIARLPVWGSAAMVFVPNLSTHRATGPRKFDMDGPARSTWTADNSQPMIFVGVSQKHADDVYVFARSFVDHPNGPNIRCSRTYRIDNRRSRATEQSIVTVRASVSSALVTSWASTTGQVLRQPFAPARSATCLLEPRANGMSSTASTSPKPSCSPI